MTTYTKSYIGKGTAVAGMDIVKVTLKVEDLLKVTHEFNGVEYLTFELAKMQQKDEFGRTHTAYVSVREKEEEQEEAEQQKKAAKETKKAAKKAKKEEMVEETANGDEPF
jgi:phage protein D